MFTQRKQCLLQSVAAAATNPNADPAFVPGDPFFENVTLLLDTGAVDAVDNQVFSDKSASNHTITANNQPAQGSFSPYQPFGWSHFFDGASSHVLSNSSDYQLGAGDFTLECWIKLTDVTADQNVMDMRGSGTGWILRIQTPGYFSFYSEATSSYVVQSPTQLTLDENQGKWFHYVVERVGTILKLFENGIEVDNATHSSNYNTSLSGRIGRKESAAEQYFTGLLCDLRGVIGSNIYSHNVTVPTEPLTSSVSNCKWLFCSARSYRREELVGNVSVSAWGGNVYVTPSSPYPTTASYDPNLHGGSCYFDGANDYLQVADHADWHLGVGGTPFTIEAWAYYQQNSGCIIAFGGGAAPWDTNGHQWHLYWHNSHSIRFDWWNGSGNTNMVSGVTTQNEWHHVVVSYDGTNSALFVDGERKATSTSGYANQSGTINNLHVGELDNNSWDMKGFVSDLQIVTGVAIYDPTQTSLAVPTAPIAIHANTKLHLPFTDANCWDATCKSNISMGAGSVTDTAQKKFGESSVIHDGSGDYMIPYSSVDNASDNPLFKFGAGDWTIDYWIRHTNVNGFEYHFDFRPSGTNGNYPAVYTESDGSFHYWLNSADRINSANGALATGTWAHIAISRHDGTTRMFVNGAQAGSDYADSGTHLMGGVRPAVGAKGETLGDSTTLDGHIQYFRVTHGIARWIGDFTVRQGPPYMIHGEFEDTEITADPHWEHVALLLKGTGDKGNQTFVDESTSNHTLTANGDVTQGTFSPFSPGEFGVYFDTSSRLEVPDSADWDFSGDFTIEFWQCLQSSVTNGTPMERRYIGGGVDSVDGYGIQEQSGVYRFTLGSTHVFWTSELADEIGEWVHYAVCRSGSTVRVFRNGVEEGSGTESVSVSNSTSLGIGGNLLSGSGFAAGQGDIDGIISGFHITTTALYTTDFTPTTDGPVSGDGNTKLITCQQNRFMDDSSSAHSVSPHSSTVPKVLPVTLFGSTPWSAAGNGGSCYFPGNSGDSITPTYSSEYELDNSTWTLEFWYYFTGSGAMMMAVGGSAWAWNGTNGVNFHFDATPGVNVNFYYWNGSGSSVIQADYAIDYAWNHFSISCDGTNVSVFVNGTRIGTSTTLPAVPSSSDRARLGCQTTDTNYNPGYMSGLRIVKGTAVYDPTSSTITVPTAPPTAVPNTKLLLNFTNAGVYDAAAKGNLETVNSAQSDTTQIKFGPSSVLFDGTNDVAEIVGLKDIFEIGLSDFCLDGWLKSDVTGSSDVVIDLRPSGPTNGNYILLYWELANNKLTYYVNSVARMESPVLTNNVWHHFAIGRIGETGRMFINGLLVDQWQDTTDYQLGDVAIGGYHSGGSGNFAWDGNLEDIRITIGEGRYAGPFVIPTSDYPTMGA